ncbi:MAG TPA: squalene/phytoene synthase family protein [Steroidobacteraceae bacterium]|nr:squalene/phytoene synthase family protein [Steroidobacteraceae bacterium]
MLVDYLRRAAPPGSMRYFALLYALPQQRDLLAALFVIDAEIRATIHAAHEVAHARLQWWRMEFDRLINRNAQHPATQVLQSKLPNADFSALHEVLVAADMELAHMTYHNAQELDAYLSRSGGSLPQLIEGNSRAHRIGLCIRRVETLRDLANDARNGNVFWALDELDSAKVSIADLRAGKNTEPVRNLIAKECTRLLTEFKTLSGPRPLIVLAELHARLLNKIQRANHDVFIRRHELGPFEKTWTAWRAARHS